MLVPVIYTNLLNGTVIKGVLDEARLQYMVGSVAECARTLSASAGHGLWSDLADFAHWRWTITKLTRVD